MTQTAADRDTYAPSVGQAGPGVNFQRASEQFWAARNRCDVAGMNAARAEMQAALEVSKQYLDAAKSSAEYNDYDQATIKVMQAGVDYGERELAAANAATPCPPEADRGPGWDFDSSASNNLATTDGDERAEDIHIVDSQLEKEFTFNDFGLVLGVDVFNVFNGNPYGFPPFGYTGNGLLLLYEPTAPLDLSTVFAGAPFIVGQDLDLNAVFAGSPFIVGEDVPFYWDTDAEFDEILKQCSIRRQQRQEKQDEYEAEAADIYVRFNVAVDRYDASMGSGPGMAKAKAAMVDDIEDMRRMIPLWKDAGAMVEKMVSKYEDTTGERPSSQGAGSTKVDAPNLEGQKSPFGSGPTQSLPGGLILPQETETDCVM